jgi:hypothetical protein
LSRLATSGSCWAEAEENVMIVLGCSETATFRSTLNEIKYYIG